MRPLYRGRRGVSFAQKPASSYRRKRCTRDTRVFAHRSRIRPFALVRAALSSRVMRSPPPPGAANSRSLSVWSSTFVIFFFAWFSSIYALKYRDKVDKKYTLGEIFSLHISRCKKIKYARYRVKNISITAIENYTQMY